MGRPSPQQDTTALGDLTLPIDDTYPTTTAATPPALQIRLLIEIEVATADDAATTTRIAEAVDTAMSGLPGRVPDVRTATVSVLGAQHLAAPVRGVFDLRNQDLTVDGSATRLTTRESAVLTYLVKRPNCAVSREELRDALDDADGSLGPRAVDVILSRLRAKLRWMPPPLATVRGTGYRYEPSAQFVVLGDTPGWRRPVMQPDQLTRSTR